jgi:hypothetical protein
VTGRAGPAAGVISVREGSMSDSDLLILAPWIIFIVGVVALSVLAITRNGGRRGRRRRDRRR